MSNTVTRNTDSPPRGEAGIVLAAIADKVVEWSREALATKEQWDRVEYQHDASTARGLIRHGPVRPEARLGSADGRAASSGAAGRGRRAGRIGGGPMTAVTTDHRAECPPCMRSGPLLDETADEAVREYRMRGLASDPEQQREYAGQYERTVRSLNLALTITHLGWSSEQVTELAVDLLMAAHHRIGTVEAVAQ